MRVLQQTDSRKKHVTRNMIIGSATLIINSLVKFVMRSIVINNLGLEYASLNSLFIDVVSMMMLTELGIGSAITYSLYKPLANNDEAKLVQLASFFRKAYNTLALVICGLGLIMTPFVHLLINGIDIDVGYVRTVFALFVLKTAVSYTLSYKSTIITANQRSYVLSIVNCVFFLLSSGVSVVCILLTHNYLLYLVIQLVFTLLNNLAISYIANKSYPYLKKKDVLPVEERKAIFTNTRSIFIGHISGFITNSTDNILVSVLVSTLSVGLYGNYLMITRVLTGFVTQFRTSVTASICNMFATEKIDRCERIIRYLSFIMMSFGVIAGTCLFCLSDPFINLWLGEGFLLPRDTVFTIALNFFFAMAVTPLWVSMTGAGLFRYDKYTSIAGSGVNLIASIILGKIMGITGILIGTILTYVVQIVLKVILIYRKSFQASPLKYLCMWAIACALSICSMFLCQWLCSFFTFGGVWLLAATLAVSVAVPALIIFILFGRTKDMAYAKSIVQDFLQKWTRRKSA